MAKIPTYFAKEGLAPGGPVQLPLNLYALPYEELEQFGRAISLTSERMVDVHRFNEYTKKSNEFDTGMLDLFHQYENDPQIHEKREEIKKAIEKFKNEKITELKDPYLYKRLAPIFNKVAKYKGMALENIANAKQMDAGRSQFFLDLSKKEELYWQASSEMESGHLLGEIKGMIFGAAQSGLITQTAAAKLWAETPSRLAFQEVLHDMDAEGAEETLKKLEAGEYENLEPDQKVRLTRIVRQEIGYEKAKARELEAAEKEAREEEITNIQNQFITKLSADPMTLTVEEIVASDLPPVGMGSKDFFIKALNAHNEAISKDKADPFKESDPKVRADMVTAVNADPVKITKDDILAKMGDGLSTKDTEHFLSILDSKTKKTDKPMRSEVFKRSLKAFDDAFKGEIFENYEDYYKAKNDFERIVMEGKVTPTGEKRDLEPKEIEELTVKMLFPHKQSFFDRVYSGFMTTIFGEEKPAEEMEKMPPASEHKGKTIRDTETGKRYRSDGEKWTELK